MYSTQTSSQSHSSFQRTLALGLCIVLSLLLPVSGLAQKRALRIGETGRASGKSAKSRNSSRSGKARQEGGAESASQDGSAARQGMLWTGEQGVTETVAEIMAREKQRRAPDKLELQNREEEERELPDDQPANPDAPAVSQWPAPEKTADQQRPFSILSPQTLGTSFDGVSRLPANESLSIPPDTVGDVGPTQILVAANGRIKVFSKAGVLGGLNADMDSFFLSVRNGSGTSDPHVRYDRLSQRWFVVIINVANNSNRVLLAVSSSATITSSASFTFFFFQHDAVSPAGDATRFADYPTLGVDKNALYIGTNNFPSAAGGALASTTGFVVQKSSILGAGPIVASAFRNLNSCAGGMITPQGVDNDDPASTEGYFIGTSACVGSTLTVRRITTPGATPGISAGMDITVPTTATPTSVAAQGSGNPLDAVGTRLLAAHLRKNKNTGTSSLWTAHGIQVNSSGVGNAAGGRNGARWYEIRNLTTTPTLFQSGTLFDSAASNARSFWIPSVAASGQGHMALGCSFASLNDFASIAVAGRLSGDALGTTQTFTIAQAGTQAYNDTLSNPQRWGDFSQTVVDPTDDMTIWTLQEYCNNSGAAGWAVRVTKLVAPPPATPASSSSAIVTQNIASTNITITGTVVSGSGFFDPGPDTGGPGFVNHISATVSGGVIVNSITYNSPTSVTLNISTVGASTGSKNVTITNPDGQSQTGNNLFTVAGPTAATFTIGGRVQAADGRPIGRATVTLTDQNSQVRTAITNPFGYYRFYEVESGMTYVLSVRGKGLQFTPQVINVTEENLNINFTPN